MIFASENGVRLHSAYNPEREAFSAVSREEVLEKSSVVFYGFGLGYHIVEIAKILKTKAVQECPRLVIIEPDLQHFFAAMSVLDWTDVFALEKLVLAVGCPAESVLQLLEDSDKVNVGETGVSDAFYFDIPSFTAHADSYFNTVRSIIKRNQRKNEINAATLKKFGRLWCRNSLKNLEKLGECGFVSSLKNKALDSAQKPLPFLIIGAGPSLEPFLPRLNELQNRCITVCVETALRALLRSGVQPDFIILTDPQFWAYRHIAGLRAEKSVFITEISAYPSVFRFDCRARLLCGSQFPVGQFAEKKLGLEPGNLGTGGSVASSAWNFAHFAGAREIFTVGLDFAFPGKQTHLKGSSAEQTFHTISNRIGAAEMFSAASIFSANSIVSKDYNGNPVLTDSRMKMFSWWFESRLASCPETKTYTLSPQGLFTPGITPVSLDEVLSKKNIINEKKPFIELASNSQKCLSENQKKNLSLLVENYPRDDFLKEYPFLKEYI